MEIGGTVQWNAISPAGSSPLNKWNFACLVIDASKDSASLFVNDTLLAEVKMNGYVPTSIGTLTKTGIGHAYDVSTDNFKGNLDDIRNYNRALSSSEIDSLYHLPNAGLVGWYPFNGSANDSSGNGNNGTAASVTPVADRFGNQGGAYQFNGSTSEVLLPNNFQTQSLTICAWYYVTQVGYDRAIFMEYKDANNRLKFGQQYKNDEFYGYMKIGGTVQWNAISPAGASPLNKWNFACLVIDAIKDSACLFLNDTLQAKVKINGYNPTTIGTLTKTGIGHAYDVSTDNFIGNLDDIRIYNRVLNSSEIDSLYHFNDFPTDVKGHLTIELPREYRLAQNYPNPFNPSTTIQYALPNRSNVRIVITNTLGQQVALLENGEREAGYHEIKWQAVVASGIYFYRIEAVDVTNSNNRFVQVKKMLLLK